MAAEPRQYLVDLQPDGNGEHLVHRADCAELPAGWTLRQVGAFHTCRGALACARIYVRPTNGCAVCAAACRREPERARKKSR